MSLKNLNYLKSVIILGLVFILACNKDDVIESSDSFELQVESLIGNSFIVVTNELGVVLFDTIGENIDQTIIIEKSEEEKIDVSFGTETTYYFNIKTYRDIKSGFKLPPTYICSLDDPFYKIPSYKNFRLEIEGISEFLEFYNPFSSKQSLQINTDENILKLSGGLLKDEDVFLTILTVDNEFKSILIELEDWETIQDTLVYKVDISEFSVPDIHEIDLKESDEWMVEAEMITENQRLISLSKWKDFNDYQQGTKVKVFSPSNINIDQLKLEFKGGFTFPGFHHSNRYVEFPKEIDLFKPSIEEIAVDSEQFQFRIQTPHDLARFRYFFRQGGFSSAWDIYSRGIDDLSYQRPAVPKEYLDSSVIMKNVINDAFEWKLQVFDMEDPSSYEIDYSSKATIVDRLCYSFNSRFIGDKIQ